MVNFDHCNVFTDKSLFRLANDTDTSSCSNETHEDPLIKSQRQESNKSGNSTPVHKGGSTNGSINSGLVAELGGGIDIVDRRGSNHSDTALSRMTKTYV